MAKTVAFMVEQVAAMQVATIPAGLVNKDGSPKKSTKEYKEFMEWHQLRKVCQCIKLIHVISLIY